MIEGEGARALFVWDPDEPSERPARILAAMHGHAALLEFDDDYPTVKEFTRGKTKGATIAISCEWSKRPFAYLEQLGFALPRNAPRPAIPSRRPRIPSVVIVEAPPELVGTIAVAHPRGSLVRFEHGLESQTYAKRLNTTAYHLQYNSEATDEFWCVQDDKVSPGKLFTTTAAMIHPVELFELVESICGASTPLDICRALQVPPEYLGLR